jgi:hypothetical protein
MSVSRGDEAVCEAVERHWSDHGSYNDWMTSDEKAQPKHASGRFVVVIDAVKIWTFVCNLL